LNQFFYNFERSDPKNNIAMNKKHYQKPAMQVVKIQHSQMLCTSGKGYEVIGTDQPNLPAGARQYNGGIDWDEE